MAERQIDTLAKMRVDFISATNEFAQFPGPGIAWVGSTAIRHLRRIHDADDRLTLASAIACTRLEGAPLRHVTQATAAVHSLLDIRTAPGNLPKAIGFAYDLVRCGLVSSAAEYREGTMGRTLPVIGDVTDEQREAFLELAASPDDLLRFGKALGAVTNVLIARDGPAQDVADRHMGTILGIADTHASGTPGRMPAMGQARADLAVDLRPHVEGALATVITTPEASVLAVNMLRHTPGPDLLGHHFPPQ